MFLLGLASLAPAMAPALAQAQQATAGAQEIRSSDTLGEIVVTATRRESTLNEVPLSIAAYGQEALDVRGVRQVDDVFRLTPGVTFGRDITGGSAISIRGIASSSGAATTGIYIDDAPVQTRSIGFTSTPIYPAVFDLERVEVLRGPQGTLFGAGSEGGTVRFITPQPDLSRFSLYSRAELANTKGGDQSYEAGLSVNTPLSDKVAVRLMGWNRRDGGYIDHVSRTTGVLQDKNSDWQKTEAFRLAALYQPTDDLKITPSFYYQRIQQNDAQAYTEYVSDPDSGRFLNNSNAASPFEATWKLPALNVTYDFGSVMLTGSTSYFDQDNEINRDYGDFLATLLGGTVTPETGISGPFGEALDYYNQTFFLHTQKAYTAELRLASQNPGRFNWQVGTFYQRVKQSEGQYLPEVSQASFDNFVQAFLGVPASVAFGGVPLVGGVYSYVSDLHSTDEQTAVFGEATFEPIDRLELIFGGRYSDNSFNYDTAAFGPYAGANVVTAEGTQKETSFTPKVGLAYELADYNRVYFTASKGFRPGGANNQLAERCGPDLAALGLTEGPTSYDSDSVWSYELGFKNRLFDDRLSINASVYQIKWDDIQQEVYLPGCGGTFVSNLGKAQSKGFDLEAELRATDDWLLQLAAGYGKATYTQSNLAAPDANGNRAILVNKGNSLGNPPWQVAAASQYDFSLFSQELYVRADYQFTAHETILTPLRDPSVQGYSPQFLPIPDQHYATLRVGLRTNAVDVSFFINNLLDDTPRLAHLQFGAANNNIAQTRTLRPRTIGVTLNYRM